MYDVCTSTASGKFRPFARKLTLVSAHLTPEAPRCPFYVRAPIVMNRILPPHFFTTQTRDCVIQKDAFRLPIRHIVRCMYTVGTNNV